MVPGSYNYAKAITPSDTVNLVFGDKLTCDAIYVGGTGTVTVVLRDDTTVQFTCIAGQVLPIQAKRVNATGAAGTLLAALYYA